MFTKSVLTALAFTLTATLASASVGADAMSEAPQMTNMATYEVADTRGMDNRQDRRDDRQDCRQTEGVGHDKRDCKQDARSAG